MRSRVLNWDAALVAYLESLVGQAFVYGARDCGGVVREAARLMYGGEVFPHVGNWKTKRGMLWAMVRAGGLEGVFGPVAHKVSLTRATTGDIAQIPQERLDALAVVAGAHVLAVGPGEPVQWLARTELPGATAFWRLDG